MKESEKPTEDGNASKNENFAGKKNKRKK